MKYRITEILPAQIKVEFEDGSWAVVPVSPDSTAEEIDLAVSKYDPDFLPKPEDLINSNISVGEERESKKLESNQVQTNTYLPVESTAQTTPEEDFIPTVYNDLQSVVNSLNPINAFLSGYFEDQGDTRIKEALYLKVQEYLDETGLTVEKILDDINLNPEDIMAQAEAELNAEQS